MPNLIMHNAYRIFGLDNNANQKDILKRYKEIINRIKIDDYPQYDLDLELDQKFRNEDTVNDSLKRLQNIKSNIIEYFFWFQISDDVDEEALNYLKNNDYVNAIQTWQNAAEINNSTSLFYKKNLAVLYCLFLLTEQNSDFLRESLSNWHEIIDSDKFWIGFEKKYGMINDQIANTELINEFRKNVVKYISDIYADLYQQHHDPKYVKEFQDVFEVSGDKTENLLKPIHNSIYETIEELDKISQEENPNNSTKSDKKCDNCGDASAKKYFDYDDGSVLCETCRKSIGKEWKKRVDNLEETIEGSKKVWNNIQKTIAKLQSQLEQLRKMGLYENNQSKIVRDHAAQSIRDVSVHIHNMAHMSRQSAELMNLAIQIAGTENVKERFSTDLQKIHEIADDDDKTALVLSIPKLFGKKDLIVKNNFMEYKEKKIYYKDVVAISYHNEETKYNFVIYSSTDKIDLTFSNHQDLWYELINIARQYIEPIIVEKLVKAIFEQNRSIQIGNVSIDKNGIYKSKLLRGLESVLWADSSVYTPKLHQGTVILFKEKNNFPKEFTTIKLEYSNAAILPELVTACYNEFAIRQQN